jgi:hypothetical protein
MKVVEEDGISGTRLLKFDLMTRYQSIYVHMYVQLYVHVYVYVYMNYVGGIYYRYRRYIHIDSYSIV